MFAPEMSGRSRPVLAALALLAALPVAVACGPDFPWQLLDDRAGALKATPANSFPYEAARLAQTPRDALRPVERVGGEPPEPAPAPTPTPATARALELYAAGAAAFREKRYGEAAERFQFVLDLPELQRQVLLLRAAYMLGRSRAAAGEPDRAAAAFALTRELVLRGADDSKGLAVASYGEEARLHLARARGRLVEGKLPTRDAQEAYGRDLAETVRLYAEQAARDSRSGMLSLRIVAEEVLEAVDRVRAAAADPLTRRLLTAYVLALVEDESSKNEVGDHGKRQPGVKPSPKLTLLVREIERQRPEAVEGADRLAALAYRLGRYDLARAAASRGETPLSLWVRAKLALQDGEVDEAATLYARASRAFPATGGITPLEEEKAQRLQGERATLALARGEYLGALERLFPLAHRYWGDVAYIAERVLTLDELKGFVDARTGPGTRAVKAERFEADPPAQIRALLARRLMRAGRHREALAYFADETIRETARAYDAALMSAEKAELAVARARGSWAAAVIARRSGMEILGLEGPPDYAAWGGGFGSGLGRNAAEGPYVSRREARRVAQSGAEPDRRYHYRYVAVAHAEKAADLLPPRSQAYAAVLCGAARWMTSTAGSGERVSEIYKRYVNNGAYLPWAAQFGQDCPEPDFDAALRTDVARPFRGVLGLTGAVRPLADWSRDLRRELGLPSPLRALRESPPGVPAIEVPEVGAPSFD